LKYSIISQEILNDLIIEIGTKFKPIMDNETKILDDLINELNQIGLSIKRRNKNGTIFQFASVQMAKNEIDRNSCIN
jgi:hypothetical protein